MFDEETTHPSYGTIGFSRVSSSSKVRLFGSSLEHNSYIEMRICHAKLARDLSNDYVFTEHPIIIVDLSPTQFADAITNLNRSGIPCTISWLNGKQIQDPPYISKRQQFDNEFERKMRDIANEQNIFYSKIKTILNKNSIGKNDRKEILKQLDLLKMQIESNLPFLKHQFTKQMDRTVLEAKNEFDQFVNERLKSLGLERKGMNLPSLELREKESKHKQCEKQD